MRKLVLLLFLIGSLNVISQSSVWATRDMFNYPLSFLTHKDSIPNLYVIENGRAFNGKDSISLIDSNIAYYEYRKTYKEHIKTYILWDKKDFKGLYVILSFIDNRLVGINMFTNNHFYISNMKMEIYRMFSRKDISTSIRVSTDSTIHKTNTIVSYGKRYTDLSLYVRKKKIAMDYNEDMVAAIASWSIYDPEIEKRIPSWCGFSTRGNSWEKLEAYINKRVLKENKKKKD